MSLRRYFKTANRWLRLSSCISGPRAASLVPQSYLLRPIMQCWIGETADVALGAAAHASNKETGAPLSHWSWPLSWEAPFVGQAAATYAFPNHSVERSLNRQVFRFQPDLYPGSVLQVGEFRDRLLVPYPYMHVDFNIHGAASGGPVASGGAVVGVNCRFINPVGPGVAAQIRTLQDSFLEDTVLLGERLPRRVSFSELVAAGAVTARGFVAAAAPTQNGCVVRLDRAPAQAEGPMLDMAVWT